MSHHSSSSNSPASLTFSKLSSLKSPRSILFSFRPRSAPNPPPSSPISLPTGLLERRTTALPFLRSTDFSPRSSPPNSPSPYVDPTFQQLLNLKKLTTVIRPAKKNVFNAPAFKLVPYAKAWHLDIIIFFTNAIRYETKGLFFILYCLHERSQTLEVGDIESFYEWYIPYHNFFITVVSVLHASFLPWLERSADLPQSTSRSYFVSLASYLTRILRQTLFHKRHFVNKYSPAKAAAKLRTIFTQFAVKLLEYLATIDQTSSTLIEAHFSRAECRQMSRALISEMATMPNFKKNLVLLLRWLETKPETSAAWRREHLDPRSGLSYGRWKRPGPQEECMAYFLRKCKAIPQNVFR